MAKKTEIISFKNKNITYTQDNQMIKVLSLKKPKMVVELACFEHDKFIENKVIPFAHLPKNIKSIINPN